MKVLLFQVDGKFPNVALMKLAAWHRAKGDDVFLTRFLRDVRFVQPDKCYSSSIFTFSQERRNAFDAIFPDAVKGGDGYKPIWNDLTVIGRNLGSNLREVIKDVDPDAIRPDYSDYPEFTASIGYSQRGCRLDCGFCRMKTREGEARGVSTLHEIWRGEPWPKHIVLLDNDFFGQKEWQERLREAIDGGFKICFNQGINIRLVKIRRHPHSGATSRSHFVRRCERMTGQGQLGFPEPPKVKREPSYPFGRKAKSESLLNEQKAQGLSAKDGQKQAFLDSPIRRANMQPESGVQRKPTQEERILKLLTDAHGEWVSVLELVKVSLQYNARLWGLRQAGHKIENRTEEKAGVTHSWYRLVSE